MQLGGKILAKYETDKPSWENPVTKRMITGHYDLGDKLFQFQKSRYYPAGSNMIFRADFFRNHSAFDTNLGRKANETGAGEEKEVFKRMRKLKLPYHYSGKIVVEHQVDDFRTKRSFVKSQSEAIGKSQALISKVGKFPQRIAAMITQIGKLGLTFLIAIFYVFRLRFSTFEHLVSYRLWVFREYLKHM